MTFLHIDIYICWVNIDTSLHQPIYQRFDLYKVDIIELISQLSPGGTFTHLEVNFTPGCTSYIYIYIMYNYVYIHVNICIIIKKNEGFLRTGFVKLFWMIYKMSA